MENIKRALAMSILARGWAAALGLLAVPIYLRFLGIEAYGVVGLFTSLSVLVGFLDLGLGATLIRELARLSTSDNDLLQSRDITRTFEVTYGLIAVLICIAGISAASPLAQHWIQLEQLSRQDVSFALALASVALACQWPANLYSSGLAGRHQQNQISFATIFFVTLRVAITLLVIWKTPTLQSFFWAQIVCALLQTVGFRFLLWKAIRKEKHRPTIRFSVLRHSMKFAGGMTGIMITSIALTQADKLILSNTLSMAEFGVYVVAGTLAMGIYMVISPMFSIMYPRFLTLIQQQDNTKLIDLYHTSSQTLSLLVIPATAVIAVFSEKVLYAWTGSILLSAQGAWILTFLIIGNACNGIMNMPYALQLSTGWTQLSLLINVGSILVLAPAIWWAATHYGAMGGAAVWALLNLSYIALTPHIMHKRLLPKEKLNWYWADVFVPTLVCAAVLSFLYHLPMMATSRLSIALTLLIYWSLAIFATASLLPKVRKHAFLLVYAIWTRKRTHKLTI